MLVLLALARALVYGKDNTFINRLAENNHHRMTQGETR